MQGFSPSKCTHAGSIPNMRRLSIWVEIWAENMVRQTLFGRFKQLKSIFTFIRDCIVVQDASTVVG